ncbi:MAG: hypothetical protein AAGD04_03620 [Pseudomonadota bacterium]
MTRFIPLVALSVLPLQALGEDALPKSVPGNQPEAGFSLMQEAFDMFFKGLKQEMDPLKEGLQDFVEGLEPSLREMVEGMGPALGALADRVDDIRNYDVPEILPNGDIIIRRKPSAPEFQPPETGPIDI